MKTYIRLTHYKSSSDEKETWETFIKYLGRNTQITNSSNVLGVVK